MAVPVVDIRCVRVSVRDGLVPVRVRVGVVRWHARVHVQVVPVVVTVPVVVLQGFVQMHVSMVFAQ